MALSENGNDLVMPVSPLYGNNGGFGGFGGGWESIIVLFLIAAMFGGFGNWGGGFGGYGDGAFPWLMSGQAGINANTNAGFDNAAIGSQLSGIQTSLTTGFSNAEVSGCNRAMDSMQTAYNNQIATMNQRFADVTAIDNRLDTIAMSQQNGLCENRQNIADLKYTVATENCADRTALSDGIRDILANQTANTQKILDTMFNDKIDAKNDKIAELERELAMKDLASSQGLQTQTLLTDNLAQTNALEQYLAPVPRPAYIVQNPNCCGNGTGCGCSGAF